MEEILQNMGDVSEDAGRSEIQSKLSTMSFEDLKKLKSELGIKLYKEAYFGTKTAKTTSFKRPNKNRPREVSSKIRPTPVVVNSKKRQVRDPRFDPLMGDFDKESFEKNYNFLNDIRNKEKERLKRMLQTEENENQRNKIKFLLQRFDNQDREKQRREKEKTKRLEERKEQIKAYQSGRTPHFKTKFEKKVDNIIDKYEELKSSGKLVKYMESKEKKRKTKERHKRYFEYNIDNE